MSQSSIDGVLQLPYSAPTVIPAMMSSLAPPQVIVDSPRPQQHGNAQAELAAGIALFIRPPTSGSSTLSTCGSVSRKNSQKRKAPTGSAAPPRQTK